MKTLPPEIIGAILSRLSTKDVMRCRAVCKIWNTVTRDPYFTKLHLETEFLPKETCILLKTEYEAEMFLVEEEDDEHGNWTCRKIPECFGLGEVRCKVIGSCHGLLCMCTLFEEYQLLIYNPIIRDCVELPRPLENDNVQCQYCFGFDSVANKFKVIVIYYRFDNEGIQANKMGNILTLGESCWRNLEIPFDLLYDYEESEFDYTVPIAGDFYWTIRTPKMPGSPERIVVFDITSEKFHTLMPTKFEGDNIFVFRQVVSSKFYEYNYQLASGVRSAYKVVGRLQNGTIIFHFVEKYANHKDFLGVYNPQLNRWCVHRVLGAPHHFDVHLFVPTLVSPTVICNVTKSNS